MKGTVISVGEVCTYPKSGLDYFPIQIRLDQEGKRKVLQLQIVPSLQNYKYWAFILNPEYGVKTQIEGIQVLSDRPDFVNKDYPPTNIIKSQPKKVENQQTLL